MRLRFEGEITDQASFRQVLFALLFAAPARTWENLAFIGRVFIMTAISKS